ncbi:MAG TPA: malonyl-CoA decarboxylase [Stellaceae bacterium]|jgi:malonyl-CoA decarboxylase|nr:malonyl-CoA decarboxylase [Stellaceae bacterium]
MTDRTGFLDGVYDFTRNNLRTLRSLRARWRDLAGAARSAAPAVLTDDAADRLREQMQECLDARGGEVSARARAAGLGQAYLALSAPGRERFLQILASDFDIDHEAVDAACQRLAHARGDDEKRRIERALRQALEPPRLRLLTQFNALPSGVKFLVDMRAELMKLAHHSEALNALEHDLRSLLANWFDEGFLEIRQITWDAPAALLEKLMIYEAVHEIRGWSDLKNRLEADRRCFAYFHPRMPDEPLIFVEVALVKGMADNVQSLLDEAAPVGDPASADSAIFYSISNCQRGLSGISFGAFLIKRVADRLAAEFPHLSHYATLSPMPGFRAWLDARAVEEGEDLLTPTERRGLETLPGAEDHSLAALLANPLWYDNAAVAAAVKAPLMRLAARYLLVEKNRRGRAADGVAHFHLSNGARVERINWLGDLSPKGIQQSAGIMINYLYRLSDIEENHEAYTGEGRVAASPAITRLLKT